jgi:hypothetical protein
MEMSPGVEIPTASREPHSGREANEVEAKPLGLLVPVSYTRCRASTSGLSKPSRLAGGLTRLTLRESSS